VGSSLEEVTAAYKNDIDPRNNGSETIIAGSPFGGIIFTFEKNKVKSIFLGAAAE
jgi:hypothetical protein